MVSTKQTSSQPRNLLSYRLQYYALLRAATMFLSVLVSVFPFAHYCCILALVLYSVCSLGGFWANLN